MYRRRPLVQRNWSLGGCIDLVVVAEVAVVVVVVQDRIAFDVVEVVDDHDKLAEDGLDGQDFPRGDTGLDGLRGVAVDGHNETRRIAASSTGFAN